MQGKCSAIKPQHQFLTFLKQGLPIQFQHVLYFFCSPAQSQIVQPCCLFFPSASPHPANDCFLQKCTVQLDVEKSTSSETHQRVDHFVENTNRKWKKTINTMSAPGDIPPPARLHYLSRPRQYYELRDRVFKYLRLQGTYSFKPLQRFTLSEELLKVIQGENITVASVDNREHEFK